MSNNINGNRPPSPLVKQLKQKFDRMIDNNLNNEHSKIQSQSQTDPSKIHRVGNDERDGAYPLLPVCCLLFILTLFDSNKNHEFLIYPK
jgi:hypothetical protein